jgi:L-lactate utilization protein LutC
MMKQTFLTTSMILVTAIYSDAHAASNTVQEARYDTHPPNISADIDIDAEKQRSMEAVKAFATSLQAELKKALKQGGATNAINVCNTRAGLIAMDVSEKQSRTLKRVSLKNRNPDNAPNEWQKKILENFENRKRSGEPVAELTYADVAEIETGKQFRFMKAIPTKAICITCHGENISAEVKDRLNQLYPNDKARGFRPGDIRGAFVVTRDFPQ